MKDREYKEIEEFANHKHYAVNCQYNDTYVYIIENDRLMRYKYFSSTNSIWASKFQFIVFFEMTSLSDILPLFFEPSVYHCFNMDILTEEEKESIMTYKLTYT